MIRTIAMFAAGGAVAASAHNLSQNQWDLNSIGLVRFGRVALTAGSIAYDYSSTVYSKHAPKNEEENDELWSQVHSRSANRLLNLCKANRGVFIKVGQHIGALDYLLPPEYIRTLRILHSQAPTSSIEDVFAVIKEDLGKDRNQLFMEFNEVPLGAASLAQVYKAKLEDGSEVAVKVQHRDVLPHSIVDIAAMEFFVRLAAKIYPDFKLLWLVEETKKNLPVELDFLREGEHADKIRSLMSSHTWLKIPKIYWKYSTKRVLIMEYLDGGFVNDLDYMKRNGISPREVCGKLGELYSDMIFVHGYVHCDPHPGNILVRKNTMGKFELCLLDHGLYTVLSDEFRYNYANFWLSVIDSDVEGIRKSTTALGVGEYYRLFSAMVTARSWDSISSREGITGKEVTSAEKKHIRDNVAAYLPQISEVLDRVPRPMILIFKTNDLIRGVEFALKQHKTMKSFTTMSKYCIRAVFTERLRRCSSFWCSIKLSVGQHWALGKIILYEWFLLIRSLILIPFTNVAMIPQLLLFNLYLTQ